MDHKRKKPYILKKGSSGLNKQAKLINNSFSKKITCFQIIAISLPLISFILLLVIIFMGNLSIHYQTALCIFFSFLFFLISVTWYKVSSIDPSDTLQQENKDIKNTIDSNCYKTCHLCPAFVFATSSHCQICKRCVSILHHHDKWINNCIGATNYFQFFWLELFLIVFALSSFSIILFLEIQALTTQNYEFQFLLLTNCSLIENLGILIPLSLDFKSNLSFIINQKEVIKSIYDYRKSNKVHPEIQKKPLNVKFIDSLSTSIPQNFLKKVQLQHMCSQAGSDIEVEDKRISNNRTFLTLQDQKQQFPIQKYEHKKTKLKIQCLMNTPTTQKQIIKSQFIEEKTATNFLQE